MTDTSPHDPQPPRRSPLGFDELIAIVVALTGIGAIFFWAISRNPGSEFSLLPSTPTAPSAAPTIVATPTPTTPGIVPPVAVPSPTVAPPEVAPAVPFVVIPVPQQPAATPAPQPASPSPAAIAFPDVPSGFWAAPFIAELARRDIITGFPDNTYRPDQPVTRAQFAVMLEKAFARQKAVQAVQFSDIPSGYWGSAAISKALQSGFMRGYPGNRFQPDLQIPKEQAIVALANGLNLPVPASPRQSVSLFQDANDIAKYAVPSVASATQANLVVNFPDPKFIGPKQTTTRAEAAALIHQALVRQGQATPIDSQYIVKAPQ